MDVGTHALASFALTRTFLPRAPRYAWLIIVFAGVVVDADGLSASAGPAAYLHWHRTVPHSIFTAIVVAAGLGVLCSCLDRKPLQKRMATLPFFGVVLLAEGFHLALDACQSTGIALFWPFSARRIAADWLPDFDPWILAILIVSIALPELFRLVGSEIGAKHKRPRGRTGAIIGLAAIVFYAGARVTFHSSAMSMIQAHTYKGELARRAGAFPESVSIFTWHGVVETDHAMHEVTVDTAPNAPFDPEGAVAIFKPESSPALTETLTTDAAKTFLGIARFPKASVEKTQTGYRITVRDLRDAVMGNATREIAAVIDVDSNGKVSDDKLVWARDLRHH